LVISGSLGSLIQIFPPENVLAGLQPPHSKDQLKVWVDADRLQKAQVTNAGGECFYIAVVDTVPMADFYFGDRHLLYRDATLLG
jgi:hypothetical protein